MNPILALFWKEGREAAYKIAAAAGLAFVIGLVCTQGEPSRGTEVQIMSHLVGFFGAVLMGMDAIALERSRMTLSFLLGRPLEPWKMLLVKFIVGAAGLLAVLAMFWGGIFLGMDTDGSVSFQSGYIASPDFTIRTYVPWAEILADVGYVRMVLLWLSVYLILYGVVTLASILTEHPLKAAMTSLMAVWVVSALYLFGTVLAPQIVKFYFQLVFSLEIYSDAGILRRAFDTSLLLTRGAVTALLLGGTLLWTLALFRIEVSRRFQWAVGALAAVCAIAVIGMDIYWSRYRRPPEPPVQSLGRLSYKENVEDLALKDGLAVVLLERGLSVVDVTDQQVPVEIGRVEKNGWRFERLAVSGSRAYVWGEAQDSAGVAVFDLMSPEHPRLRAHRLLLPIEQGPSPWLRRIPRLVGWAVWDGFLYGGIIRDQFLELHSFDVRDGGLPRRVQVLPIEEATKHAWNNGWEMRIVGPHGFLTLGHDFVVLDLADPGQPEVLSRTPLRRFGRSNHYEKLVQEFRQKLTSSGPGVRVVQMDSAGSKRRILRGMSLGIDALSTYKAFAPPALGPLTVTNDMAYIERHVPREIAVVDISDPRKPVEVDYVPWTYLPRRMTISGESAYALSGEAIQTYVKTGYGTFSQHEKLVRDYEEYLRNIRIFPHETRISHLARDMFILEGDYIYALLNNHLAIFENPRKKE